MEEIIVIRAADPDGSVFQAVVDALKGKRAEVVSVAAPVSSMLRIGELEIYHEQDVYKRQAVSSAVQTPPCSVTWLETDRTDNPLSVPLMDPATITLRTSAMLTTKNSARMPMVEKM